MNVREQYNTAAVNAVYQHMARIRHMTSSSIIATAMAEASPALVNKRSFEDIFFDDMMNRFVTVMAPVRDRAMLPEQLFFWMLKKRYGDDTLTKQDAHNHLTSSIKEIREFAAVSPVPDYLQVITDYISAEDLATLTNEWNDMFKGIVHLTSSDDALEAHHTNIGVQNAFVEIVNDAIAVKSQGGNRAVLSLRNKGNNGAPKLGNGFGDDDGDDSTDMDKLGEKLSQLALPEGTLETVRKLYKQTRKLPPNSMEFSTNFRRLDTIAALPWGQFKDMNGDITKAQDVLDSDHYGLDKVKDQIIQHIAVQNRTGAPDGKIMLLVGPPGVGKTSIAQSVAKATGREYIRIALGGVSKESDVRGHASAFVGAMPGRIIQEIKKAKSSNPLVVLDEIDKLGAGGAHGDPSAALLELLDPAQNHTFRDDYIGVEFDMSKVLFFCTANEFGDIPGPLRDRMQVLHLSGYTQDEKMEIAQRYLVPKQLEKKKLDSAEINIEPAALKALIEHHTGEAGVRTLEKKIGEICSKVVVDLAKGKQQGIANITPENLEQYVGTGRGEREQIPAEDQVGVVNGLAYSSVGGSILPIEVAVNSSHGFKINVTGNLGKVMGESASVAESLVRSRAPQFGITDSKLNQSELRIHAPAGATPKDGPSAGAAFTTAIISALTGVPIRRDVAMTGEINLRGQVTAIGGLPEKLEGALKAGVKTVLIPKENIPHLNEVSEKIKSQLEVIPVATIEEVLAHALTAELSPVVTKPLTFGSRLRQAWDLVMNTPSNDNKPTQAHVRQPAGPRHDDLKMN